MKRPTLLRMLTLLALVAAPVHAQEVDLCGFLGLGYGDAAYGNKIDHYLSYWENQPGADHLELALDFGFYAPVAENALMGPIMSAIVDNFDFDEEYLAVSSILMGISYRQYMSGEIGKGFFWRGDVGFATALVVETDGEDLMRDAGFGLSLGGGYSVHLAEECWIALEVKGTLMSLEGQTARGLSIGASWIY